jgi:hypothetical protein
MAELKQIAEAVCNEKKYNRKNLLNVHLPEIRL